MRNPRYDNNFGLWNSRTHDYQWSSICGHIRMSGNPHHRDNVLKLREVFAESRSGSDPVLLSKEESAAAKEWGERGRGWNWGGTRDEHRWDGRQHRFAGWHGADFRSSINRDRVTVFGKSKFTTEISIFANEVDADFSLNSWSFQALGGALIPYLSGSYDFFNGVYYAFLCLTAIEFGESVPRGK